jgi:hypothetical protein
MIVLKILVRIRFSGFILSSALEYYLATFVIFYLLMEYCSLAMLDIVMMLLDYYLIGHLFIDAFNHSHDCIGDHQVARCVVFSNTI